MLCIVYTYPKIISSPLVCKLTRIRIRVLDIDVPNESFRSSDDFQVVKNIAGWSNAARILKFRFGYFSMNPSSPDHKRIWDFMRHISTSCQYIEVLHLERASDRLPQDFFLKQINFPRLKSLHLEGLSGFVESYQEVSRCPLNL